MARIHHIRHTTPGAIATCSVLARWALSADESFQTVGSATGIHYSNDYQEYLTILETGLRQKKKSILNVIKQWDDKIFPDSESSLVLGKKNNAESGSGLKKVMDLLAGWQPIRWRKKTRRKTRQMTMEMCRIYSTTYCNKYWQYN